MAFLGAMSTPNESAASTPSSSTANPITTTADLQRTNSAAELLSIDPQLNLLASMQNAAANNIAAQVNPNDALNSGFYQQLLAQMQQNSQTISPPSELASNINNDLIQQLTSSLLANSSIQPQLANLQQSNGFSTNPNLAPLSGMINASPSLLPSLLNANNQQVQNNAGAGNVNLASQLLLSNGNQNSLLAVLNLLQTNPMLTQQLAALQQQQQAQQQLMQQANSNLALFAQLINNPGANAAANRLTDINQLAALLQQAQVPSQGIPCQGEQTPKPAFGRLSAQNSSNSLLAGLSGFDSPTLGGHPIATSSQNSIPDSSTHMISSANNSSSSINQSASRQASSDRLLSESVQDHISRLISENEAIVEPNPVLLKRRPYHRQSTSNSITSQTSENIAGSSQNSPSLFHQVPNNRLPTTRSQSMHESQLNCGSLTSGQPIVRHPHQQALNNPQQQNNLTCSFCNIKFPNDAGLKAHEMRCSKKEQLTKHQSQPQLQWNLQQQQIHFFQQQQQQKLLAQKQHQSNIAALVGGGAGVKPDPLILNGTNGRSSVPIGGSARSSGVQASPPIQGNAGSPSTSSTGSENRHPLKKRLLESVAKNSSDGAANSTTSSPTSVTPSASTTNSSSMPNIDMHEAQNSPAKIAKLSPDATNTTVQNSTLSDQSSAQFLLQQLIKQILYSPIVSAKCPKAMQDSILYCASYIEAKISTKMPYMLILDRKIAELHRKHNEFMMPSLLLWQGKSRNVTVELNTTHKPIPNHRPLLQGQSEYANYHNQKIVSVEDEMHLLLSLRDSCRPIRFPNYTSPNDTFKLTHSDYWKQDARDRILAVANSGAPESLSDNEINQETAQEAMDINQSTESASNALKIEDTQESPAQDKPDNCLTEAVTKRPGRFNFKQIGKERTEEVDVYVRGRGRGRYVCEQCGIKCKKPSMLKKHLNVHTDVRMFKCITCNFAFKTKGNLTKHLLNSKAHRIKVASSRCNLEVSKANEGDDPTQVATSSESDNLRIISLSEREAKFVNDGFDNKNDDDYGSDDNETEDGGFRQDNQPAKSWRFGQENILWQRSTHTPPTLWTLCEEENLLMPEEQPVTYWPSPNQARSCHSAPPAALCSPTPQKHRQSGSNTASCLSFNTNGQIDNEAESTSEVPTNYDTPSTSKEIDFNCLFSNDSQEFQCEQCDKKFRKASELHFHRQTHLIEQQQNTKNRSYQCPECKVVHRSRAHLEKHLLEQHESTANLDNSSPINDLDNLTNLVASGSTASTLSESQSSIQPNMRKYCCIDCGVGFRTHGVLVKHLRTKNHIKSLAQKGKLPEDAMNLIKENSNILASLNASNCEQARRSLLRMLDELRENQAKNESLECSEQLARSPSKTELAIGISQKHANNLSHHKPSISAGQKRKNSERNPDGESASQRPRSNSCMIGISTSAQKRLIANDMHIKSGASTPGGFNNVYKLSANGRVFNSFAQQNPSISTAHVVGANVWTPPLVDQLLLDEKNHHNLEYCAESVASSTREEVMSESTERSEASSPINTRNSHNNANLSSPIPIGTLCMLCDHEFDCPANLQVHYNAEHISFHDGNDFKCPRRNCDKIFPNRLSLRSHIKTHFFGATPIENSVILMSPSEVDSNNIRKNILSNGNSQVPNHSPGAPEATHTVSDSATNLVDRSKVKDQADSTITCNLCNSKLANAQQLQTHWIEEHINQLNSRPHICAECDAAFTTAESLQNHLQTHR